MKKIILIAVLILISAGSVFYFVKSQKHLVQIATPVSEDQTSAPACVTFPEGSVPSYLDDTTGGIKYELQPALITDIDYTKKTITFDYIQNVRDAPSEDGDYGGLEYDNINSQLRTFKFDSDTTVHSEYLPVKSWIDDPCTNETRYEFYNLEAMNEIVVKEDLEYYLSVPFVYIKLEGDTVKHIEVQYES